MSTRTQKVRLGIFMLAAALLFGGAIVVLAGLKLWNPKDRYFVSYQESISGLELGSTVKMKGVRVGQIEDIHIGQDVESVVVTLSLTPGTPVPEDTRAVMTSIGITGLKFVELTGGSSKAKRIKPNLKTSVIQPGTSALESLTGKATDIAIKMEELLNNLRKITNEGNQVRFRRLLEDIDKLAVTWTEIGDNNKDRIASILTNADRAAHQLAKASKRVSKATEGSVAALEQTLTATANAAKSIHRAVSNLNPQKTLGAITSAANTFKKRMDDPALSKTISALNASANRLGGLTTELSKVVRQRDRQLGSIMKNIDRAAEYLRSFSRSIKERPSLLLRGNTRKERDIP